MNDNNIMISDELLSAFLEGNTSAEDTIRVLKAAEQDEELREIIRISKEVDDEMFSSCEESKSLPMTAMAARQKIIIYAISSVKNLYCISLVSKQPTKVYSTKLIVTVG